MKHLFAAILITALTVSATAASGSSAKLPFWQKSGDGEATILYITNIADEEVTVTVTFYDQDGNVYTEASEAADVFRPQGFQDGDALTASGATLAPNQTANIYLHWTGARKYGHAVIQWKAEGDLQRALIAHASQSYSHSAGSVGFYSRTAYPVNKYWPF